jgi:hypothetical protein
MKTVYLVSCVSKKRAIPMPARELYTSDWFVKARAYVERTGCPWFILSAEYGLVHPDRTLRPYDRTLNTMSVRERKAWAARVEVELEDQMPPTGHIVVLAGLRYREYLMDCLHRLAKTVEVPMEGLSIGRQLQYFKRQGARRSHGFF